MTDRLLILVVGVVALLGGIYLSSLHRTTAYPPSLAPVSEDLVGQLRPDFKLGNIDGQFVTPQDFEGSTLLINFWATWCEPCIREMPMLSDLQTSLGPDGLQVVGIALDDVQAARNHVEKLGINYPILVGGADVIATSHAYGNGSGVLPYTVLVDRKGFVRWQYAGEIEREFVTDILTTIN